MKNLIQEEFDKFALQCFGNISKQQYIDLRRTFFGGASTFYSLVANLSSDDDITEGDLNQVAEFREELIQFNEDVKAGRK